MTTLPPFKQLFSESYEIFRLKWRMLLLIQIVGTVGIVALAAIIAFGAFGLGSFFSSSTSALPMVLLVIGLVIGIVYLSSWMAAIQLVVMAANTDLGWKQAVLETKPLVWKYLVTMLLMQLLIVLLGLLLVIPAIIFGVYWSLSQAVFMKEGVWGMAALKRSKALVKGNWKAVFGRWAVLVLISLAVIMGFTLLSAGLNTEANDVLAAIVGVLQIIFGFVWGNLMMIFGLVLYRHLRDLKTSTEG